MAMEIILREDVEHLGKAGEVVKVKDGYARNYLLPQGAGLLSHRGEQEAHHVRDRPRRQAARRGESRG